MVVASRCSVDDVARYAADDLRLPRTVKDREKNARV
jgi:hypothetical protein